MAVSASSFKARWPYRFDYVSLPVKGSVTDEQIESYIDLAQLETTQYGIPDDLIDEADHLYTAHLIQTELVQSSSVNISSISSKSVGDVMVSFGGSDKGNRFITSTIYGQRYWDLLNRCGCLIGGMCVGST